MSTALLRPMPLPLERTRPGALLLVVALHLGLLWVANLYWPLQNIMLGAVQNTAQSITLQILQKSVDRLASTVASKPDANATPLAISNTSRQRFGRAEAMLALPASQLEASTPLAGTAQTALAVPARSAAAVPMPTNQPQPNSEPPAKPAPQMVAAPEREPAVIRLTEEKLTVPTPAPTPASTPAPTPESTPQPVAAAPPLAVTPPAPAPAPVPVSAPAPAAAATAVPAQPSPAATRAASAAAASGVPASSAVDAATSGAVSTALPAPPAASTGAPLNLNLPPRYIYRPPIALPRRSLSELANEQLRRKPRDAFAEGIESAGNIDCLKDTPDGPAQGLLAIGPLLKRAIEEKCRK